LPLLPSRKYGAKRAEENFRRTNQSRARVGDPFCISCERSGGVSMNIPTAADIARPNGNAIPEESRGM